VGLPIWDDLLVQTKPNERKNDICFVLGPSGSGKAFFAVNGAAKYVVEDKVPGLDNWTVVVLILATDFEKEGKIENWIVEEVKYLIKKYHRIGMVVCWICTFLLSSMKLEPQRTPKQMKSMGTLNMKISRSN
jgi:PhoH-like protein